MGKSTISTGPFSIAMLVYQRVLLINEAFLILKRRAQSHRLIKTCHYQFCDHSMGLCLPIFSNKPTVICLVVEFQPLWKMMEWTSVGIRWNSQLMMGKVIKFHGSKPPTSDATISTGHPIFWLTVSPSKNVHRTMGASLPAMHWHFEGLKKV